MHRRPSPEIGEVPIEIGLELVQQHDELGVVVLPGVGDVGGIDNHGAESPHRVQSPFHQAVGRGVIAEELRTRDADAGPLEPVRVEERGVVRRDPALAPLSRGITGIDSREHAEQDRGVGHSAGHRARRVLAVGDGDDPRAADEAKRRLDADE